MKTTEYFTTDKQTFFHPIANINDRFKFKYEAKMDDLVLQRDTIEDDVATYPFDVSRFFMYACVSCYCFVQHGQEVRSYFLRKLPG